MAQKRYVTIQKDDQEGQCLPVAVKAWERNGWTVVDDGDSEEVPFYAPTSEVVDEGYNTPDDLQDEE